MLIYYFSAFKVKKKIKELKLIFFTVIKKKRGLLFLSVFVDPTEACTSKVGSWGRKLLVSLQQKIVQLFLDEG